MHIELKVKSVYGNTVYYPVNHAAACLAKIAGTKTLTAHTMKSAKDMGCTFGIVAPGFTSFDDYNDSLINELLAA